MIQIDKYPSKPNTSADLKDFMKSAILSHKNGTKKVEYWLIDKLMWKDIFMKWSLSIDKENIHIIFLNQHQKPTTQNRQLSQFISLTLLLNILDLKFFNA